jgi:hypothetical protein
VPKDRLILIAAIFMAIGVVWGIAAGAWAQAGVGVVGIAAALGLLLWQRKGS